jgi:hypothetical protein
MPKFKSLVRRQDVEGLPKTASYKDLAPSSVGTVRDRGIPVRAEAVLALGRLAPEAGLPAIRAGLGIPRTRCDVRPCASWKHSTRWVCSHDRCGGCLRTAGTPGQFASRAIIDLRKSVRPSVVADALVHREDDDPLGEHDAQLIHCGGRETRRNG